MAGTVHVGDIGTIFERQLLDQNGAIVNLSTSSTKELWFLKPGGSTLVKAASFTTDGTDGKIRYASIAGDLDQAGTWTLQAHVILPGGEWHSDGQPIIVSANVR